MGLEAIKMSQSCILNCPHRPHPHVTILITYPFPHYEKLIVNRCCCACEKGRTPKVSKGCYPRATCPIILGKDISYDCTTNSKIKKTTI